LRSKAGVSELMNISAVTVSSKFKNYIFGSGSIYGKEPQGKVSRTTIAFDNL
jgi:hypothetical protein